MLPSGPFPTPTASRFEAPGQRRDVRSLDSLELDLAARLLERLHEGREIEAVVHGAAGVWKSPWNIKRFRNAKMVVVTEVVMLLALPPVEAQLALTLQRDGVLCDRVEEPHVGICLGGVLGNERDVHVVLAEIQAHVKASDAASDDSDFLAHPLASEGSAGSACQA